jgi:hypothetical protein
MLGRTGVTVRNGTVTDFDGGVVIDGGSANTITGITARHNIGGTVNHVQSRFGDGVAIESSSDNRIINNATDDNGPFSGIGLYSLVDSDHPRTSTGASTRNLIQSNQVVGNVVGRDGFTSATDNDGIVRDPFRRHAGPGPVQRFGEQRGAAHDPERQLRAGVRPVRPEPELRREHLVRQHLPHVQPALRHDGRPRGLTRRPGPAIGG